jgi:ATP-binding cassette subfamily F protein 3
MLTFKNLQFSRSHKTLVDGANIAIAPYQKVGVVGPNGCGKSTLFALIRGELASDVGECFYPKDWRLAYVEQEIGQLDCSAFEYVLEGHAAYYRVHEALEQAEIDGLWEEAAELHQIIDHERWYHLPGEARSILHGLGFPDEMIDGSVGALSGGFRVRLALAKSLFTPSECLLLDEPTNHLDIKTLMWLESYLKNYKGTLLMISHDIAILDAITDSTLAFFQGQLKLYKGNYSSYEKQQAEQLMLQQKMSEKQQKKVAHLTSFINRFKAKASKAKQAQSRIKQLEKMEVIATIQMSSPFSFEFNTPDHIPTPLIRIKGGVLGYGDKVVLKGVNVYLGPGDRIGLVGENGAGKSTFAKTLVGELPLIKGHYTQDSNCVIGYFAQHQLEQLDPERTPFLILQDAYPRWTAPQIRTYLGSYNFREDQVFQAIHSLSGGEKARLVLSLLASQKPHLIILDEPTNHLDIDMRQALTLALQTYEGAVVIISHDRNFLNSNVTSFFYVNHGTATVYDTFDEIPLRTA